MRRSEVRELTIRTAIHEAGHAVAYWLLGSPVQSVAIIPDRLFAGHTLLFAQDASTATLEDNDVRAEAIALMAGLAAERLALGAADPLGGSSDLHAVTLLLAGEADLEAAMECVERDAVSLVTENWTAVSELAHLLLAKKSVDGDVVAQIVRQHLGIEVGEEPQRSWRYDIWSATVTGNIAALRRLLADGADPNVRNDLGMTPLHEAAGRALDDVVRLLLDSGADPSLQDAGHHTPLSWAMMRNHSTTVAILQADVAARDCERAPSGCDEAIWYYRPGTRTLGPVAWTKIERLTADGTDPRNLLVARGSDQTWMSAADVRHAMTRQLGGTRDEQGRWVRARRTPALPRAPRSTPRRPAPTAVPRSTRRG